MVAAETLQTLHRMHIQIADLQSRLERGPRVVAISQAAVDNLAKAWEASREALKRARMASDGKQLQLRHLSRDCHKLLNRAGQLIVDSDDDPDYGLPVDYDVRTGMLGGGH